MILKWRSGTFGAIQYVKVPKLPAVLGRDSRCDVWIPHAQVDGQHVRLEAQGQGVLVVDLQSQHGLKVDGRRQMAADLKTGSVFQLGTLRFEVDLEDGAPAGAYFPGDREHLHFWGQSPREWGLTALAVAGLLGGCLFSAQTASEGTEWGKYTLGLFALWVFLLAGVVSSLSFFSRVHTGHYRLWPLFRAGCWIFASIDLGRIVELALFNVPWLPRWLPLGATVYGTFLALYGYVLARIILSDVAIWVLRRRAVFGGAFVVGCLWLVHLATDSLQYRATVGVSLVQYSLRPTSAAVDRLGRALDSVQDLRAAQARRRSRR